ncbi:MAG: hypothetical protein WCP19_05255 [Chloroflexota bacterium]
MNSRNHVLKIPDTLGFGIEHIDSLYQLVQEIPQCESYTLEMDDVSFVKPYGFLGLVLISQMLAHKCGKQVNLINLRSIIHQYFHRMNIVSNASSWLSMNGKINEEWDRNPAT